MKNVSHSVVHFLDAGNISLQYFQPVSVYLYIYIFLNFDIIESMIESSFRHSKRIKKITGLMIFFLYRSDIERELDAYCQYKMTIMQSSQSLDVANISQCDVQIALLTNESIQCTYTEESTHKYAFAELECRQCKTRTVVNHNKQRTSLCLRVLLFFTQSIVVSYLMMSEQC